MTWQCIPLGSGEGPVVYWMTGQEASPAAVVAHLAGCNGILTVCQVPDWNHAMTPWPAPPAFGQNGFSGGAEKTLRWLCQTCMRQVTQTFGGRTSYVCGYSLGGLFSLWALCESAAFRGAASCSGSLWYPGWIDYVSERSISREKRVYLSLGTHEERTHNETLAAVGPATRQTYAFLQNTADAILEWNPGGHFHEPEYRMARGIRWLLEEEEYA